MIIGTACNCARHDVCYLNIVQETLKTQLAVVALDHADKPVDITGQAFIENASISFSKQMRPKKAKASKSSRPVHEGSNQPSAKVARKTKLSMLLSHVLCHGP